MEEKTEQLRDIFLEVADEESVTETQAEQRGSLIRTESVDDRLSGVVGRMRERFDFRTDLDEETLVAIVERFYDGETDAEMADALGVSPDQVFTARTDLHILRDEESAVDRSAVREHDEPEASDAEVAAVLSGDGGGDADADVDEVARARRALEARREARLVSHRFRTEFEEVLTDADVAVQFTTRAQDDGLEEAAEDIETDVEF
jgi:hypothetical protein